MYHCVIVITRAIICDTVVIGFILGLEVADGQVSVSARARAREAIRDPLTFAYTSTAGDIHEILRGLSWALLEPNNSVAAVLTAKGAGKSSCGSQGCRHGGRLSQHRLGKGT